MRTAVVILCVNSGADLSFAWYLPYLLASLFPPFKVPYRGIATYHLNAMLARICFPSQWSDQLHTATARIARYKSGGEW
jgi:hypothetical protein